jgi:hypothetical protein
LRERARLWGWRGGLPELLDEVEQFLAEQGAELPNALRVIPTDELHREAAAAIAVSDLGRLRALPGLRNLFEPIPDLARGWREMYPYGLAALDAAARAARYTWVGPEHVGNWLVLALAVYARTGYAARLLLQNLVLYAAAACRPALVPFLLHCFGYTASAIELLARHDSVVGAETLAQLKKLPLHDDWREDLDYSPGARATMVSLWVDNLDRLKIRDEPSDVLDFIYFLEFALGIVEPHMLEPDYALTRADQKKLKELADRECPEAFAGWWYAFREIADSILNLEPAPEGNLAGALVHHLRGE